MLLKRMRDWPGAERCYRRAIEVDAGSAAAHFNLSNLLLQRGRWSEGFVEYEWRLALPGEQRPFFPYPEWVGDEPTGTRVLLWGDQGYGDTIQFLRFAEAIAAREHRVLAVVKAGLRELVAAVPGIEAPMVPAMRSRKPMRKFPWPACRIVSASIARPICGARPIWPLRAKRPASMCPD